eukprot:gene13799-13920_t
MSIELDLSSKTYHACYADLVGPEEDFDVVVIGAGIGGLSCAALLAYYGLKVVVCEAHSVPGGAAHCWARNNVHFDSGTALFFGLPASRTRPPTTGSSSNSSIDHSVSAGHVAAEGIASTGNAAGLAVGAMGTCSDNPLAAVLTLLDEPLDLISYGPDRTCLVMPQGNFKAQIGAPLFGGVVQQLWGPTAQQEWLDLQQLCRKLAAAAVALHPMVVRYDPYVALTAALRRPFQFMQYVCAKPALLQDQGTCGAPAAALPATYMVRAFAEMYQPGTQLQWPCGGPQAIADALVRGLRKFGGKLLLRSHVVAVLAGPAGQAAGVQVASAPSTRGNTSSSSAAAALGANFIGSTSRVIRARKGVVSNASPWDTVKLVPQQAVLQEFQDQVAQLQPTDSFIHLHAVVDLPVERFPTEELPVHSYFLSRELLRDTGWPTLTISTAIDASLAPAGKQVLHMYMSEPFEPWDGLTRGSTAYEHLKQQRASMLWGLAEQVVPEARQYLDWQTVGTPLTHQRFRRRYRGAYGGAKSGEGAKHTSPSTSPQAVQAMKGLYCCGDCVFPWIGTPAVAASGAWVANTLAPVWAHWNAVNKVDKLL